QPLKCLLISQNLHRGMVANERPGRKTPTDRARPGVWSIYQACHPTTPPFQGGAGGGSGGPTDAVSAMTPCFTASAASGVKRQKANPPLTPPCEGNSVRDG